ncbi:hypothetical protein Emag_001142 [Eimeria magna]
MGRFARLVPRLVSNWHMRLTQTNRVCAKQLLDSALLAPAVEPSSFAEAPRQKGSAQGELHSGACAVDSSSSSSRSWPGQHALEETSKQHGDIWAAMESHALLALPTMRQVMFPTLSAVHAMQAAAVCQVVSRELRAHRQSFELGLCFCSPAGILQYLYLTLRGNTHPQEFLEELSRFLLHDEPLAPPVAAFWRLWTANDLALFCKLLLAHGVDEPRLFAQVHARMAMSLQHFSPSDAALVLSAAAKAPRSRFTLLLLHLSRPGATVAAAAEAHPEEAVAKQQRGTEEMLPGTDSDKSHPYLPAEAPSLFVSLLRAFVTQASASLGFLGLLLADALGSQKSLSPFFRFI